MAANVETMFYVREKPWHNLGVRVEEAPTSADALKLAGLDWKVIQKKIKTEDENEIPNYFANVRDRDNKVLGVVSQRYSIVQNEAAFAFTDELIGGDVRYEVCGSLKGGRSVWLLARLPDSEILGDKFERYLCFLNSHDGEGAVRVFCTNIRCVCQNTINLALNTATRSYSVKHMGLTLEDKICEARACLQMANDYDEALKKQAERYANYSVSDDDIREFLDELFPITEDMTERQKKNVEASKNEWMIAYYMPDIAKFRGTAWAMVNATSDFVGHSAPQRRTDSFEENRWGKIMSGHPVMDRSVEIIDHMMSRV